MLPKFDDTKPYKLIVKRYGEDELIQNGAVYTRAGRPLHLLNEVEVTPDERLPEPEKTENLVEKVPRNAPFKAKIYKCSCGVKKSKWKSMQGHLLYYARLGDRNHELVGTAD